MSFSNPWKTAPREPGTPVQTLANLRGEVAFRRKLADQHVTGRMRLPDYFGKEEHDAILRARMAATVREMRGLQARGVRLSPFLELGAERGQRSLALVNDLGAAGIAADISFDQLKTAEHFARLFGKPDLPLRVCCDANRLPVRSGSLAFVFCYEALHHFPALAPVIRELHRVLGRGSFYFNEEPYRRPRLPLIRRRAKAYAQESRQRSKALRYLSRIFVEEPCDEREHGILENHDIPLREWIAACRIFDARELTLASLEGRLRSRLGDGVAPRNALNALLGGGITGLCGKTADAPAAATPLDALICPDCLADRGEEAPLRPAEGGLDCPACGVRHPQIEGVYLLLPRELFRALYPELCAAAGARSP